METHIRGLRSPEIPPSSYGSLLSSILINKVPEDLRLVVSRRVTDSDWDLNSLMNVIVEEIDARERAVTVLTPLRRQGRDIPTAAVLMTSDTTQGCSYCCQNHPSSTCKVVTDVGLQKLILHKSRRCSVCLRKYHIGKIVAPLCDVQVVMDNITQVSVKKDSLDLLVVETHLHKVPPYS